ncbi:MAG TPA: translocation/assembly module TamB domain-containing protein [Candidatus Eisenbacteria bacterium]|nr:translocation/assembly module TamB domain-containing protein [Candidatus Eisenbacteria bacterium]
MTRRHPRHIKALAIGIALASVIAVSVWWIAYTQEGAKWGFERLGSFLPGNLDVEEMRGPLRGPLEIHHLTYRSDRLEITAEHVVLNWRMQNLWRRQLDFTHLHAEGVRVLVGSAGDTQAERDSLYGPLPDLNLPVSIIVRDGLFKNVTLTTPGNDSGLVLDQVAVEARSMRRDSLWVNRFQVRSKMIDLDFRGVALPRGAYPVALSGSWAFRAPDRPAIQGQGTVAGTLDTLRVRQTLSGPLDADIDLRVIEPVRRLGYDGDIELRRLATRDLDPRLPEATVAGRVHVEGAFDSFSSEGSLHGTTAAVGPARADFRVARAKDGVWHIQDLIVTRPGSNARFGAQGTVVMDTTRTAFDLETQWAHVGWPLDKEPLVTSDRGTARIQGTPGDFGIRLNALLAGRDLPPGTWTLNGRGRNGRLAIQTYIADILGGRITGSGEVAWQPRVRWNLAFDATNIDPGTAWPGYPGNLAFTGRTQGTGTPSGPSGTILVSRLAGTLRSQPISGLGTVTASAGQYSARQAWVQWGPNRVDANGEFGRHWSLDWKLDAPRLAAAIPQASGTLRGTGSIQGARGRMRVIANVTGDSLFVGRMHAGSLRANGDVNLAPGGALVVNATATELSAGDHVASHFQLAASGTRDQHQIRAAVAGREDSTVAVLVGGYGGGAWRGQIRSLDSAQPRAGHWSLASPAPLVATREQVEVQNFVWQSGTSRITVDAAWSPSGAWNVDSRFDQVALTLFEPFLPPRIRLTGTMQGQARARSTTDHRILADVNIVPGPGEVLYMTPMGQWIPNRFDNAAVRASVDGGRLRGTFQADLVDNGTVRAEVSSPAYAAATTPVDGHVTIRLRDLGMLQGFTNDLASTSGSLDADLVVGGTMERPYVQGPVHLRNASADLPRLGLQLREATVEATGSPGGRLAIHGSVLSGGGRLLIDGTAAVTRNAEAVAHMTIKGDRVQTMNTKDMQITASPDLTVDVKGSRIDVTGQVTVPEGKLDVGRQDDKAVIKPSDDVVYTGADTLDTVGPWEIHSNVRVILGDNVTVRGYGLEVKPTGSILTIENPGLPVLARGRLEIHEGTYNIYGQDLEVTEGSLLFAGGPITNPTVRARASRKADDGTVAGFIVRGTVLRPEVSVFSEPAMGQSEALSYILFGKPIEKGNLSQGQVASTMASTLGVPGTNLLAHNVASELGIEQAKIAVGSSLENTSVMLGTHLTSKIFVSAGMDVFEAASTLKVRYVLNRIFTIEAETSRQNRVDLLYTVER